MDFEWDEAKAASNLAKHGVPFEAAADIFKDAWHVVLLDRRRDYGEDRLNVTGMVDMELLTLTCTIRRGTCRVISLRRASRKERRTYGDHEIQG